MDRPIYLPELRTHSDIYIDEKLLVRSSSDRQKKCALITKDALSAESLRYHRITVAKVDDTGAARVGLGPG